MPIPIRPQLNSSTDHMHILSPRTTTVLSARRGRIRPSHFKRSLIEFIPAVQHCLELSNLDMQQAHDALSPSSVVVLVLPAILNLVPLALLSRQTSSLAILLLYTVLTDVLTVVPLFIKGVELIIISKARHYAVSSTLTSSMDGSNETTAAAQIWAVKCQPQNDSLFPIGVFFTCFSVCTVAIGIALELIARNYISRKSIFASEIMYRYEDDYGFQFDDANVDEYGLDPRYPKRKESHQLRMLSKDLEKSHGEIGFKTPAMSSSVLDHFQKEIRDLVSFQVDHT